MQCGTCGSQDTTPKSGISKKTGKPWKAYDCNESACKNEKGYPSRTFAYSVQPTPSKTPNSGTVGVGLEAKIDQILAILKTNFPKVTVHEEETTPF